MSDPAAHNSADARDHGYSSAPQPGVVYDYSVDTIFLWDKF